MAINRATMKHRRRDAQTALRIRLRETGREPGALWLSAPDGNAQAGRLDGQRQAHLSTVHGDELAVRIKLRKKIAWRARVPAQRATQPNEKWSMHFVAARLLDGRWFGC